MHPDVILLHKNWFELCRRQLIDPITLISPEDIGCGPLTRPFGLGKPESSFMLFDTRRLKLLRRMVWRKLWRFPFPERVVDFYGEHITHNLPERLRARGLSWFRMSVHCSDRVEQPIFEPEKDLPGWSEELSHLRYGLGNFYSVSDIVTHYHNWYDRISARLDSSSCGDRARKDFFPTEYIRSYTLRFLKDLEAGQIVIPSVRHQGRMPAAL
jgi:hypothetical protein